MNPPAQMPIRCNSSPHLVQQRSRAEATPQLQTRQLNGGGCNSVEHRQGVLIGIEMTHPKEQRIARDACIPACRLSVSGHESAAGLWNLVHRRAACKHTGLDEGARL